MVELNIVESQNDENVKPMGGTELMWNRVYEVYQKYEDKVDLITNDLDKIIEDNGKKKVVWVHDLAQDPKYDKLKKSEYLDKVDKFIFVSDWQQQNFIQNLQLPYHKCDTIKNAIIPIDEHEKPNTDKFRFIYTSTPHRGLHILFNAVKLLTQVKQDFEVEVYSSYMIYGWKEQQEKNKYFFDEISKHPNINYHGTKSNDEVREVLKNSHCFVYPSIYVETYCLAMIEAMSAGCACIVPNLGALIETGSHFPFMYNYTDDHLKHSEIMAQSMYGMIQMYSNKEIQTHLEFQKLHTNRYHSWYMRRYEWDSMFKYLVNNG